MPACDFGPTGKRVGVIPPLGIGLRKGDGERDEELAFVVTSVSLPVRSINRLLDTHRFDVGEFPNSVRAAKLAAVS